MVHTVSTDDVCSVATRVNRTSRSF